MKELLRKRRADLGLSLTELADRTGIPRSYISACENGSKFPSKQWVEKLAALPEPAPELLLAYHRAAFDRTAEMRHPFGKSTSALAREIECPPEDIAKEGGLRPTESLPSKFEAITGRARCFQHAIDLIRSVRADRNKREPVEERVIFLYSPSLEKSDYPWQRAILFALNQGWTVVHTLRHEDTPERRIQRVRDLLTLVGRKGHYIPIILPREGSAGALAASYPEVVVVPDKGVLQFNPGAMSATYLPWKHPYDVQCRNVAKETQSMRARGTQLVTQIDDPGGDDLTERLPAKVVFDNALTDAIMVSGRKVLVKNGCVLSTMPPHVTLRAAARLKSSAPPLTAPLIDSLTANRIRRWQVIENNVKDVNQHICSIQAIVAYLAPDCERDRRETLMYKEHDLLYGRMQLSQADCIEHIKVISDILRGPSRYEIGLVEDPGMLPIPVERSYWLCTESGLFFAGPSSSDGAPESARRFISVKDSAVIEGFFQVADGIWENIPAEFKDRESVAALLDKLVDEAEQGKPMLQRPLTYAGVA